MRITDTSDLWYKNAVIYCLDVKRYADSNGDGWGDFVGLSRKVDYLADLGVTCIWLMPFYPSPLQDDGYDIADFYTVDPRLGSLGDVVDFLRTAHDRGIRVIADLVPNHTSVEHPWFQSARKGPDSPFHDWYVWSDDPPPVAPADVAFPGEETSIWQYDEECGRYYLHRFYRFQPDLDVSNPEVRNELTKIAGFWTELGIDGFRMDAVPALPADGRRRGEGPAARPARLPARPARLPRPPPGRDVPARRGEPAARPAAQVLRRRQLAGALRLRSTSSRWPTCGCRWPAVRRRRSRTRSSRARRSRRSASGRPSCATTTS